MHVEVTVTRHTKVGTFRPGVIYAVKPEEKARVAYLNKVKKDKKSVFKFLSDAEAKKRAKEIQSLNRPDATPKLGADKRSKAATENSEMKELIKEQAEEIATYKADATQSALDIEALTNERDDLKAQLEALTAAPAASETAKPAGSEKAQKAEK